MPAVEAMEANLRATLGIFALARPDGETRAEPGIHLVFSGIDYAMFNAAMLTAPVGSAAELGARVERAASRFVWRRLPWSVWLCTDWLSLEALDAADRICTRAGLAFVTQLPGMYAEQVSPPARILPELEYRRVDDAYTREGFARIMSMAFGVPGAAASEVYESESTWRGAMSAYVGLLDGLVVTSAATVVEAGLAGVYAVGTLPAYQRHGYAEGVMRYALVDTAAEHGVDESILQSSAPGYRLYERMGYRPVTRYIVYASV